MGMGSEHRLEFTVRFYPHSAALSVSELGAGGWGQARGLGQEDLSLGVRDEALGIGSEVGSLGSNNGSQRAERDSPAQAARALEWQLRGLPGSPWHPASPLPPSLPTRAHCPPARLAISFCLDTSYLSPPRQPDLHPPTYPDEASRFLTKRNHCQMKYITIKYLILLVSREPAV